MTRFVLDTSMLPAALGGSPGASPALLLAGVHNGDLEAVACPTLIEKLVRGLEKPYFRACGRLLQLEADRRPLLAKMSVASVVCDLVTIAARHQQDPIPAVLVIDEFSAIAAEHVARLFARARAAAFSLILATQELATRKARHKTPCATKRPAT